MAKSSQISGVKSDPGREIRPINVSDVDVQSFVVGKYDEYGHRRVSGETAGGTAEGERLKKLIQNSMQTRGGNLMPGFVMTTVGAMRKSDYLRLTNQAPEQTQQTESQPTKTTRKKTKTAAPTIMAVKQEPVLHVPTVQEMLDIPRPSLQAPQTASQMTFPVVFSIESGTIRSSADSVLESEMAIVLVYRNQDAISYTPQQGSKLNLILPENRKVPVMYLGMQFQWYNTDQQLLIFIKQEAPE